MAELIVLLGMGESGKTTYAKSLRTHKLLNFDSFRPYGNEGNFNYALVKISKIINENTNSNFVLDGYAYPLNGNILGKNFTYFKRLLTNHIIKPVVILSDIDLIVERVLKRGSSDKIDRKFIINLYKDIFNNFDIEDIIINDRNR